MNERSLRRLLGGYLLLLLPFSWMSMRYDRYAIDGDAVSYMDIADLLHAHRWGGAVNAYWHPLYPAFLWFGQVLFHTSRATELRAYYAVNFGIFVLQVAALLLFVRALVRFRQLVSADVQSLLSTAALQLLGTGLLVIASMREMSLGKVRTDGLLQALLLLGLAMLMKSLTAVGLGSQAGFAAAMGLCLGLAYLTKSFALLVSVLCMVVLAAFALLVQKRGWIRSFAPVATSFVVFALVAGPYIAALSRQKHRFDFGDSGSLNYAWYVSGTEKMHLEPWMTESFGSATVHLVHPEQRVLAAPGVYSYKALPYGTYPPWFDATYFNEQITPKFSPRLLLNRDSRNVVLIVRYLLNHPEPLILLVVLLCSGATLRGSSWFALPAAGVGLAMWVIYTSVNVEERYVTVAYFAVLLPIFAALQVLPEHAPFARRLSCAAVVLFSALMLGELVREDLANRRDEAVSGPVPAWQSPQIFGAAEGLARMGVRSGDEIACVGTIACVSDHYWARLAGVRILTEVYAPSSEHLIQQLDGMLNREQVYEVVRRQGAQVIVGTFDPGEMNPSHPAAAGWIRLGETNFYALPMRVQ